MPQIIETHRDQFTISTDPARLDIDAIADMLSRAYWAKGRTREVIAHYLQYSLTFGIYDGSRQIGLARIVSDYTTFAWLCDVFIHEDYRGQGLGKWLMQTIHSHPDLQGLRRWLLATRDAHGLYAQYGWRPLANPERWMENFNG
ncbi:MAG: GNAT family N-acetyltransferase [Anaerolineales bacterium]|nr:GNAT family N-acetyltransferase [Anaerolineales bacterium]